MRRDQTTTPCVHVCLSVCIYMYVFLSYFLPYLLQQYDRCWLAGIHIPSKFQRQTMEKRFYDKNYSFIVFQKVVDSWASSNPASKSHILSPNTSIVTKNLIVQRFVHFVLFLIKLHEQLLTFLPNFRQATAKDGIVFV